MYIPGALARVPCQIACRNGRGDLSLSRFLSISLILNVTLVSLSHSFSLSLSFARSLARCLLLSLACPVKSLAETAEVSPMTFIYFSGLIKFSRVIVIEQMEFLLFRMLFQASWYRVEVRASPYRSRALSSRSPRPLRSWTKTSSLSLLISLLLFLSLLISLSLYRSLARALPIAFSLSLSLSCSCSCAL